MLSRFILYSDINIPKTQEGIEIAFNKVLDLTEMEIVETLKVVLTHHRRCRPPPPKITSTSEVSDTMQVDLEVPPKLSQSTPITSSSATLTLASYLHLVATYPTSRVPLLIAFRLYLQDPEDVTTLVQMLSSWIERRSKMDMDPGVCRKMMPNKKDLKKTKEGVWIVKTRQRENLTMDNKKKSTIPPLEKVSPTCCKFLLFDSLPFRSQTSSRHCWTPVSFPCFPINHLIKYYTTYHHS